MSNVDLFGNIIEHREASQKQDAKTIYAVPIEDATPKIDRTITEERLKISPNTISVYENFLAGPNDNSIATADLNFVDNFHDCKMSQSAVKTIRRATQLICYISRKENLAAEKQRIINDKLTKCGCTTKRFADTQRDIRKNYSKIISDAKRNISGYCNDKGKWIDGKNLCTFITLTLPSDQRHTDDEITAQLINPFFVWARKQKGVRYYVWKKELQANGNIHFHIIWDKAVNWQHIRKEWNALCNKGKVAGISEPFDYVDRYTKKWSKVHANGFNREFVADYVANSPTTALDIDAQKDAWEIEKGREMTIAEYDKLSKDVIDSIVADYERAYNKEIEYAANMAKRHKKYTLWSNPNSTDIRAVKSPRMVAAYLSKYIAKDIDNNPALTDYNNEIEQYKAAMKQWRKEAEALQKRGEDYSFAMELWQQNKDALDKYRREKCPIKGRMWFKSQSLTVFLKGVPTLDPDGKKRYYNYEQMDNDYIRELNDLEKYLDAQEKEVNRERAARAAEAAYRGDKQLAEKLKTPIHFILERYEIPMSNADIATKCAEAVANGNYTLAKYLQEPMTAAFDNLGTSLQKSDLARAVADIAAPSATLADRYAPTILQVIERHAKTICKTFVISVFDLQQLKTEDGKHRFPYLSLAWSRHIKNCRCYNLKRRFVAKITPKAAFVSLADIATFTPYGNAHVYGVFDMPFEYVKIENGKYNVALPGADFYLHCTVPPHCAKGQAIANYLKDAITAAARNRRNGITADGDTQRLHEYLLTKIQQQNETI